MLATTFPKRIKLADIKEIIQTNVKLFATVNTELTDLLKE
jgi:hypothetical protein